MRSSISIFLFVGVNKLSLIVKDLTEVDTPNVQNQF